MHRSTSLIVPVILACLPGSVTAQASRATQAVGPLAPTSVGSAPMRGVRRLDLPLGQKAFVREQPLPSPIGPVSSGVMFQRTPQGLVETALEKTVGTNGPGLKATAVFQHVSDAQLVHTGPWTLGTMSIGFKQAPVPGFKMYVLRPLERPVQRGSPRLPVLTRESLTSGAVSPPTSRAKAIATTTVAATDLKLPGKGCSIPVNAQAYGEAGELQGFACYLLLQDGQGTTLPDGTKLFRRDGAIEVWKGDAVERIEGMVVRDATGRHWAVEFKGYMS